MKVKSESEVAQSCLTLCNLMDCSPPGSSVHGIFQARVLEWVPLPSPHIHTTLYKKVINKGLLCSTGNSIQYSIITYMGKALTKNGYMCMYN